MARERPLDLAIVGTWLASWDEGELFSDAAVQHLQSLIADTHCLVVVTLDVAHERRSLLFRRLKRVVEVDHDKSLLIRHSKREREVDAMRWARSLSLASSLFVSQVAPVAPPIGQLWHQTGVKSETVPRLERVLRWDGEDWVIAGHVIDSPTIMKQGKQGCDFQEALAYAHGHTRWFDCEFIYTHDGSTWGNA
jgi:hypothetical protein